MVIWATAVDLPLAETSKTLPVAGSFPVLLKCHPPILQQGSPQNWRISIHIQSQSPPLQMFFSEHRTSNTQVNHKTSGAAYFALLTAGHFILEVAECAADFRSTFAFQILSEGAGRQEMAALLLADAGSQETHIFREHIQNSQRQAFF